MCSHIVLIFSNVDRSLDLFPILQRMARLTQWSFNPQCNSWRQRSDVEDQKTYIPYVSIAELWIIWVTIPFINLNQLFVQIIHLIIRYFRLRYKLCSQTVQCKTIPASSKPFWRTYGSFMLSFWRSEAVVLPSSKSYRKVCITTMFWMRSKDTWRLCGGKHGKMV